MLASEGGKPPKLMSTPHTACTEWTPARLAEELFRPATELPFVLDVRNREEFEAWRIEGRQPPESANVPYFEMLERGGKDDMIESVVAFVQSELAEKLPTDRTILAVCAKGGTSEYVAEGLRRLGYDAVNLAGGTQAWGNHYTFAEAARLSETGVAIVQVARPARGCLSYIVAGEDRRATVVDPLRHVGRYEKFLLENDLVLERVMDTHGHADHISGGRALAERAGAPYYLQPFDGVHPMDVLPARFSFEYMRDGDEFPIGGSTLRVLHIPGHTLGNTALLLDGKVLFSGDSVFLRSIARPDLGGRAESWAKLHYRALRKVLELPDETLVLPGHFASMAEADEHGVFRGTLGELKERNEGLVRAASGEAEFLGYVMAGLQEIPEQYIEIKRVNAGLSDAGEERASELELGKNICALAEAYE